uniref:Putative replication protein n=1 Tax=viral metagenome TaxID=1070528 RepID=A0A6M3LG03_9ZZZZ
MQELHQSISDTGAGDAPHRCKRSTTTGAGDAPPLVQEMHPISKEISKEIKKDKPPIVPHPYSEIIEDLNNKAGTKYRSTTPKTQGLIKARFNEGFTLEDFKTVHTKKCKEWLGGEYAKFLRPETLYGTKFEGYLNQTILPSTTEKSKTRYDLEVEEAERREAVMKRNEREQAEAKREREEDARRIQLEKVLVEAYWKGLDTLEQKMIEGEADLQTRAGFKNRTVLDDSAEFRLVFKAKKHIIIMEKMEEK